MTIHNTFQIADAVSFQNRESSKNTFSPDGNDFAAMLALYSGNEPGDKKSETVESLDKYGASNRVDSEVNKDGESREAHKTREARAANQEVRVKTEDGKSSDRAVQKDERGAVKRGGNSVQKRTAGVMRREKGFFKTLKNSAKKWRSKKIEAAGIAGAREKLSSKKAAEAARPVSLLRDKTRTKRRRDIKVRFRLSDNHSEAGKRVTANETKSGIKLPFMQNSVKNTSRTIKISKTRKKIKQPHFGNHQMKTSALEMRQKTESVLFDYRRDNAGLQKDTKVGDSVSAVIKYEQSAQNVNVKTHYQFQKIADGNFDEIIKQFTLILKRGGGEARLHLHPESLGELKLSIKLNNNEVSTNMLVDNQTVRDLIMARLNMLEESLQEQGFRLGSFQVEVKDRQNDSHEVFNGAKRGAAVVSISDDDVFSEDAAPTVPPWMSTLINITV